MKILTSIITVVLIMLNSIHFKLNSEMFSAYFNMSFYEISTVVIALLFTFYFTRRDNVKIKQKEMLSNLLLRILEIITSSQMYKIETADNVNFIRTKQRSVFNKIDLLIKVAKTDELSNELENDIEYMKQEFSEYWEVVSENIENLGELRKSQKELQDHLTKLEDKLEQCMMKLYD